MKKVIFIMLLSLLFCSLLACNSESSANETESESLSATEAPAETAKPATTPKGIVEQLEPTATVFSSTTNCKEAILLSTEKETLLSRLEGAGFTKLDASRIEGATFDATILTNGKEAVTLYSKPNSTELRVMWEPLGYIGTELLSPNNETATGSVSVAQIGTERDKETDNPLVGMCYVIKLASGKAIVIDGGFNNDACEDNLYNSLVNMGIAQIDGKYAIEAWIVTHNHIDHSGTYGTFAQKYANAVELEYIISAYPGSDRIIADGSSSFYAGAFRNAKLINPHASLKYHFGNAVISMFYTPDMLYDPSYKMPYYNNTSLVFKLEAGESEIMFFGDAGDAAARKLLKSYDKTAFKSDIFQMTHHGLNTHQSDGLEWTSIRNIYSAIDAHTVLLPMQSRYDALGRNGRYTVLIEWSIMNFQISYVTNKKDNHGLETITQDYFNEFTAAVENGTSEHETLYGYDGINKITNENGLVTYLGASETKPMITLFELSDGNATLTLNQMLYGWLGAEDIQ